VKRQILVGGAAALSAVALIGGLLWAQPPAAGTAPPPARPATPTTRVAMMNMTIILKGYSKLVAFRQEMENAVKLQQDKLKGMTTQLEGYKKDIQVAGKTEAEKDQIQKEVVRIQRALEDATNDAKITLNKRNDDMSVQIYKEIQDMAGRFAAARGYELILTYNDAPPGDPAVFSPMNVVRKMQTPPLTPLYVAPGMDITNEVLSNLNAAYRPAAPTAPPVGAAH
jgi:Skp family chaperone for outer membrane proteins